MITYCQVVCALG